MTSPAPAATLATLEPDLRRLYVDADDADGPVAEAVAAVARGWLDLHRASISSPRGRPHDLAFPIDASDDDDVATDADELRGRAEAGPPPGPAAPRTPPRRLRRAARGSVPPSPTRRRASTPVPPTPRPSTGTSARWCTSCCRCARPPVAGPRRPLRDHRTGRRRACPVDDRDLRRPPGLPRRDADAPSRAPSDVDVTDVEAAMAPRRTASDRERLPGARPRRRPSERRADRRRGDRAARRLRTAPRTERHAAWTPSASPPSCSRCTTSPRSSSTPCGPGSRSPTAVELDLAGIDSRRGAARRPGRDRGAGHAQAAGAAPAGPAGRPHLHRRGRHHRPGPRPRAGPGADDAPAACRGRGATGTPSSPASSTTTATRPTDRSRSRCRSRRGGPGGHPLPRPARASARRSARRGRRIGRRGSATSSEVHAPAVGRGRHRTGRRHLPEAYDPRSSIPSSDHRVGLPRRAAWSADVRVTRLLRRRAAPQNEDLAMRKMTRAVALALAGTLVLSACGDAPEDDDPRRHRRRRRPTDDGDDPRTTARTTARRRRRGGRLPRLHDHRPGRRGRRLVQRDRLQRPAARRGRARHRGPGPRVDRPRPTSSPTCRPSSPGDCDLIVPVGFLLAERHARGRRGQPGPELRDRRRVQRRRGRRTSSA